MADWANLPKELLSLIVQRLLFLDDFIVVGAVCKSWQSTIALEEQPSLPPRLPWLMLAEDENKEDDSSKNAEDLQTRCFFSLSSAGVYNLVLPEATRRKCLGTFFGWLLTIGTDLEINLLHPFSRHQISLPPQPTFSDQYDPDLNYQPEELFDIFVSKAVLSSNPCKKTTPDDYEHQDCVIMTIYGEYKILAFARPGDKAWTNVRVPSRSYDDIVYHKGQFYAVDCHGVVVVCDIYNKDPSAIVIAPAPTETLDTIQKYLVESSGDLLLVSRIRGGLIYNPEYESESENKEKLRYLTIGFSILKMEQCAQEGSEYQYNWARVNSLGNRTLFLGNNSSVSLSALDFNGCIKANCIYFTDDNIEHYPLGGGGHDMGIFNMEDGTIEPHYAGQSLSCYSPPLWYI